MISAALDKEHGFRWDVLLLGACQLLTSPLLFAGWIWSINHGAGIFDASEKDENSKQESFAEESMTTTQLIKYSLAKLLYEFVGTYLIGLLFIMDHLLPFPLFLGLWIATSFCIRISGAHFNPCISFAFSVRRDTGGLPRKLAVCYILAQVIGAALAGFTCIWMLVGGVPPALPWTPTKICVLGLDGVEHCVEGEGDNDTFRVIWSELLGSFLYVFFYLSQTEKKTVVSNIETIHCLVLAASYITARTCVNGSFANLCNYGAILNPAFAIGIFFSSWFNSIYDFGDSWKYLWLYPVFPLIGAVGAIFFFEFVYKKTTEMVAKHGGAEPEKTETEKRIDEGIDEAAPTEYE